MTIKQPSRRSGAVVPIIAVCLVALMGFVALAIDIGMMIVARSQCQNAADIAALGGARTLNGKDSTNNVAGATAEAHSIAMANSVLNAPITAAQVTTVKAGIYRYDTTAKRFKVVFDQTPAANEAYGVMQVTVMTQPATVFAQVLGINSLAVGATATAVHRPRDVAVVLDFSGSMAYCSEFAYPQSNPLSGSLNPDSRFPCFGPWSIWGGAGMVLDPNNPGTPPSDYTNYVPPTPLQRVWPYIDSGGEVHSANNMTTDTRNGPAMVTTFVQSDNSTNAFVRVNPTGAFPTFTNVNVSTSGNPTTIVTPAPDTFANQLATGFVGDLFPLRSGATTSGQTPPTPDQFAQTVADYLGIARASVTDTTRNATFEQYGYDWDFTTGAQKPAAQRFQGFTMGPGYYGKTFYMWPPDPRAPVNQIGDAGYVAGDWRRRFFLPRSGSTQNTQDDSMFWSVSGRWKAENPGASANYLVNYDNVLNWLKRGPQTLPPSMRSGRVIYYDSIPDTIPIDPSTGLIQSSATADQCFWKDFIDYVIGAGRYVDANVLAGASNSNGNTRNGANLYYNNPSTSGLTAKVTPRSVLVNAAGSNPVPYLRYDDNVVHPRMQFWFGPLAMLGYLRERQNYYPGTTYEAPSWQLKVGIKAAIDDIKNNHPNDMASMIFFSSSYGYNTSRAPMGKQYTLMQNSLFYPFPLLNTLGDVTASIRPYTLTSASTSNPAGLTDNTDTIIPNPGTQTSPMLGFMVAYNEFSNATGDWGVVYTGRRGAAKVVIFETDGVPNMMSSGTLKQSGSGGPGNWYYSGTGVPSWYGNSVSLHVPPKDNARAVVRQIVALETANPPGYSTARLPARVHAIGFGELFESYTPSAMKPAALQFLCAVQIDGKTSPTPPGTWDTDSLDYNAWYVNLEPYKIITGSATDRIDKIRQAMQRIMQGGVEVALVQ
jgi:hypothetical protein